MAPRFLALSLAASIPWAIDSRWLATILEIARHEGPGPDAVATQLGRPLENTHAVTVRDGVAIVPVVGPIFRRANIFTDVSGATSTEMLARDIEAALADPAVSAVLLEIDSPGGEAHGIHELAAMIYDARGHKPIVAYVGGLGASAAYWLASAADEVIVDATAMVGSIGVVQAVPNPDAKAARDIEIVSSQSPNKRLDPKTDAGRAVIQANVDSIADVFVTTVARNRSVTPAKVLADFGRGGVLVGAGAVAAGMADRLGSLEEAIAQLRAKAARSGAAPWVSRPGARRDRLSVASSVTDEQIDTVIAADRERLAARGRRRGDRHRAVTTGPIDRPSNRPVAIEPVKLPEKPPPALTEREREKCALFGWSEEEFARVKTANAARGGVATED